MWLAPGCEPDDPFVQLLAAFPHRLFERLVRPGDVPVERHRDVDEDSHFVSFLFQLGYEDLRRSPKLIGAAGATHIEELSVNCVDTTRSGRDVNLSGKSGNPSSASSLLSLTSTMSFEAESSHRRKSRPGEKLNG